MRLGGPILAEWSTPDEWAALVRQHGYSAAYCPQTETSDTATIASYSQAAAVADIVIAEVGAWSNPISPDPQISRAAIALCQERLALAEAIGARCCVNIAGSRGQKWDGPHPDNLTSDTFALIVDTTRAIIDAVKPVRTFYTLETMPWIYPDSPESYRALLKAIDRPAFGVHLDPVNLICSPQLYFQNAGLIRSCFAALGPYVKSCHAKDIILREALTVHLDEVRPGAGQLDYKVFLHELNAFNPDIPLMLEHLPAEEEYAAAAAYIRSLAQETGIPLH